MIVSAAPFYVCEIMNGWRSRSDAFGLYSGSTVRHNPTKELKSLLHFYGYVNPLGGCLLISMIALKGLKLL